MKKARCQTPTDSYVTVYPKFVEFADHQLEDLFWLSSEHKFELDKPHYDHELTPAELHAVIMAQEIFTQYELKVGIEYWLGRVMRKFPRPEIQRMCSAFGNVELNVHAPTYSKMVEVLGLATDEFYTRWQRDETLRTRFDFIESTVKSKDDAESLAGFIFIEGAVLYSTFALLRSFSSNGRNLLPVTTKAITASILDEDWHCQGAAYLFQTLLHEQERSVEELADLENKVKDTALAVYEHECAIIKMYFEKGEIAGITEKDLKTFVASRINICLDRMGYSHVFTHNENNPIEKWFELSAKGFSSTDFFVNGVSREYTVMWDRDSFGKCWEAKIDVA